MEQTPSPAVWRLKCECGHQFTVSKGKADVSVSCPACGHEIPVSQPPPAQTQAPQPTRRPCPFCLEAIHPNARKCPFCQEYLDPQLARPATAPAAPRTSLLAAGSLILGVLGPVTFCLTGLPAAILGVAGLLVTRAGRLQGKGMAIAGLLMGILWTVALAGLLLLVLAAMELGGPIDLPAPSPAEPLF